MQSDNGEEVINIPLSDLFIYIHLKLLPQLVYFVFIKTLLSKFRSLIKFLKDLFNLSFK